ncbi:MAG TPA: NADH-quinone oxidoreductase subunit C [Candidatus Sumerlaeota bacterium]|nr:NADH-quinone oxidoreductase subunit C [Candidatus Sumerlaeota bacterium]HOR28954.1 NADH-quinone oxidoreductase subunit C [Candidatus Sumerlaeota bacterium]
MTPQEIHARLTERFGDAIGPWTEPERGDPHIAVAPGSLHAVCAFLRDDPELQFDYLQLISGVDWTDRLSSVYHLMSLSRGHGVVLRVDLERGNPRVASVADLWPTADWHEREAWDLLGIVYEGHPGLRRILLPEDWEGHPLRKDYAAPAAYHGVTNA